MENDMIRRVDELEEQIRELNKRIKWLETILRIYKKYLPNKSDDIDLSDMLYTANR